MVIYLGVSTQGDDTCVVSVGVCWQGAFGGQSRGAVIIGQVCRHGGVDDVAKVTGAGDAHARLL
jgi:hypothetical protein